MKEIKFRVWFAAQMFYNVVMIHWSKGKIYNVYLNHDLDDDSKTADTWTGKDDYRLMQFTGLKDKNGKEIFEGDIFRIEEDSEDKIFYVVIVWVKEWCMFCTLIADSEYFDYINDGIEALDKPMFWTYTLEDTDDRRFFLCGNIYQNPELIKTLNHESKRIQKYKANP